MPGSSVVQDDKIAFLLVTGLCSGMSMITCGFVIFTMGVSFNLRGDRNRQQFLALVGLCAAICGTIGNGLQEGHLGKSLGQKIVSFFFNWLVQVGLAGIAHTSIIRLLTALLRSPAPTIISRATYICCIIYVLTLPAMTPTFIALIHPSNIAVKTVARNMNIAFVCAIELLAIISDVMLLRRFTQFRECGERAKLKMVKEIRIIYTVIWLSICADITAKVYRNVTNTLVPDLTITNLTLTLRCMAALMYGTKIQHAQGYSPFTTADPVTKNRPNTFDLTNPRVAITLMDIQRK